MKRETRKQVNIIKKRGVDQAIRQSGKQVIRKEKCRNIGRQVDR